MTPIRNRSGGFTLIELTIALMLMAAMASIMFGSLSLAARSWDGGEAKAVQVSDMRQTQAYLREQIGAQFPQRLWKITDLPLLFGGERDEIRFAAALPERVAEGGVYYFRILVVRTGDKSQLVQERMVPDLTALQEPDFREAERSILAEGIGDIKIAYFGRDARAADADTPTWRDRWDDKQRLPLLVRVDVIPVKGTPWPTLVIEPRRSIEAGCPVFDPGQGKCVRAG